MACRWSGRKFSIAWRSAAWSAIADPRQEGSPDRPKRFHGPTVNSISRERARVCAAQPVDDPPVGDGTSQGPNGRLRIVGVADGVNRQQHVLHGVLDIDAAP